MNNFNVHIFIFQDIQFKKIEISITYTILDGSSSIEIIV